ncbi:MAG TPA: DUF6585 family protein [Ktedonobacterales bacterium]|jgi:ribosomal protein L14
MASLTPEAQQLISKYRLGASTAVYQPNTVLKIIGFLFLAAFFAAWTLFTAAITNSPLLPNDLHLFDSSPLSTSEPIFQVVQILFPLVGLLGIVYSLWQIVKAIGNSGARAVVCTHGAALVTSRRADAFRWQDAITVTHNVKVSRSTHQSASGVTSTSTSVRHRYTVHCHDGRKILFDSALFGGKVQKLGETLQVEVARWNQGRGARP